VSYAEEFIKQTIERAGNDLRFQAMVMHKIDRLHTENEELKNILKDFLVTKECRETWISEMHCTIKSYFEKGWE
jgi:hypothetical protein